MNLNGKTCKLGALAVVHAHACLSFISCFLFDCALKREGENVMEGTEVDLGAYDMGVDSILS